MDRSEIYKAVDAELDYADAKWGTEFDDKNTLNDWAAYAGTYIGKATAVNADKGQQIAGLTKAIGLLVNALIRVKDGTVAKRHYDK